jgi:hypothetical protein
MMLMLSTIPTAVMTESSEEDDVEQRIWMMTLLNAGSRRRNRAPPRLRAF